MRNTKVNPIKTLKMMCAWICCEDAWKKIDIYDPKWWLFIMIYQNPLKNTKKTNPGRWL